MKQTISNNRLEVVGAELKCSEQAEFTVGSLHSNLYLSKTLKQAMLFQNTEEGVIVSISENNEDAIELINCIEEEVEAYGGVIEEVKWTQN